MQELERAEKTAAEFERSIKPIIDYSAHVEITNEEALTEASDYLKKVQVRKRELEAEKQSITKPINDGLKKIRARFDAPIAELDRAAKALKNGIAGFHRMLEERQREAQRKAEEAARKERERIEAQERKERERAEAKIAEKRERLKAAMQEKDEADAAGDTAKSAELAKEIAKLEASVGKIEQRVEAKTEQLHEQASSVVAPVVQHEAPKMSGVSMRSVWKAEVTDLDALIKAAANGDRLARACLCADQKVINQQAKSLKDNFTVPGVRVWEDKTVAA